ADLIAEREKPSNALDRLLDAVAASADAEPVQLRERIDERQHRLDRVNADLAELGSEQQALPIPTRQQLLRRIGDIRERLGEMKRELRDGLEPMVGAIRAVPHQQFGSNKPALRGRFVLDLTAILPAR